MDEAIAFDPGHRRGEQIDGQLKMREPVRHLTSRPPIGGHRRERHGVRRRPGDFPPRSAWQLDHPAK
jgi:hypothetical protein